MKQVWKYPIGMGKTVEAPLGARPVHAAMQGGDLCVWMEFDHDEAQVELELEPRSFKVVGTGRPFPGGTHVGSFLEGPFVWHVYETGSEG